MGRKVFSNTKQNKVVRAEFWAEKAIFMSAAGRQNKIFYKQNLSKPSPQLGWRKTGNSTPKAEGTTQANFVTLIVQSYFDSLLRYVLSVSFCGATVLESYGPKDTR